MGDEDSLTVDTTLETLFEFKTINLICYEIALGVLVLWIVVTVCLRCRVDLGKQKPKQIVEKSLNKETTTDIVQAIGLGETKSIAIKKNAKYSTPAVEDLIKEDELIIGPK